MKPDKGIRSLYRKATSMPTHDHRLDLLGRLTSVAQALMQSGAYDPRPAQQPISDRVALTHLCFELGDAFTLLGTRILDGEHPDASRELARRLVDLLCVAEAIDTLPPGEPTAMA
jgi:hypothetical protein